MLPDLLERAKRAFHLKISTVEEFMSLDRMTSNEIHLEASHSSTRARRTRARRASDADSPA